MRDVDVVIVGGGIMGAAAARALAGDRSVFLLEQAAFGHRGGSSHGPSRIFRYSYPTEEFVAMAHAALPLWRDLERESHQDLVTPTGGLDTGPDIAQNHESMSNLGIRTELMDGAEANRRFPTVSLPDGEAVLFQADTGWIAADLSLRAFVDAAVAAGAETRERTVVKTLQPSDDGVEVVTEAGTITASVAVVTAGAWARELLAPIGIDLSTRVTRETVAYFRAKESAPPVLVEWGPPAIYAVPSSDDEIKVGEHIAGPTVDPDTSGAADPESIARVTEWVQERFPHADPDPVRTETCLYTNTDDERFILERHGPIVVGSPCSGHGFKFAPLIGKRLAELATS